MGGRYQTAPAHLRKTVTLSPAHLAVRSAITLCKMGECVSKGAYLSYALERARIFRRLRLSLRDLFFFHFSLMLEDARLEKAGIKRIDNVHDLVKREHLGARDREFSGIEADGAV
jgi:hypothetical protein